MTIRAAAKSDLAKLYTMNQAEVPHVGDVTSARFQELFEKAVHFPVLETDHDLAGFLVLFDQDSDYDSPNFLWFRERYERFLYLDRVVISQAHKRKGMGRKLYDHCRALARQSAHNLIALEVNTIPPNPDSMGFHRAMGFKQVGTRTDSTSHKAVSMQILAIRD